VTVYVDCTTTRRNPLQTGIQRVVRNIVRYSPGEGRRRGLRVVPVYLGANGYHPATTEPNGDLTLIADASPLLGRKLLAKRLYWASLNTAARVLPASRREWLLAHSSRPGFSRTLRATLRALRVLPPLRSPRGDVPVLRFSKEDTFIALDLNLDQGFPDAVARIRRQGARIVSVCYDLFPLQYPDCYPDAFVEDFRRWIREGLARSDAIVCISRSVANELGNYRDETSFPWLAPYQMESFRLGHDFGRAAEPREVRPQIRGLFAGSPGRPVFMAVGWIDVRKNQQLLVKALDLLHEQGVIASLVLFGQRSFTAAPLLRELRARPQSAARIVFIDDASDAEIDFAYRSSAALLYPSLAEGFGLPLVEALGCGAKVFASDIPVFRELASGSAVFFDPRDPGHLARLLHGFCKDGHYPVEAPGCEFSWPSWAQSAREFFDRALSPASTK
jgi:glycosyltransferase involved in cell wall biosynthesis